MPSQRITKNDTYSLLIAEGIDRGFIVVPEFRVRIPEQGQSQSDAEALLGRSKSLDLVWLEQKPEAPEHQGGVWSDHWTIVAAFEVEGCNVSKSKEFMRHINDLPRVPTRGVCPRERFVFLYTVAFDRSPLTRKNWDNDILERLRTAQQSAQGVDVLSAGETDWRLRLPR